MPYGSEKANEFKRYRQILAALYIAIIALGCLLLAASVVKELYFRPVTQLDGPVLSAENPTPENLLRCHDEVVTLLVDLDRTATQLIALPPLAQPEQPDHPVSGPTKEDQRDVIGEWRQFSRAWLTQWDRINAFCRFSELEDTRMGEAYDRMARVFAALPTVRRKYQSLLARFDDELPAELARMRRDLQRSRALLFRTRQGAGGEQAP